MELLETLKVEKLRVDHWQEKEATRDAVRVAIRDFLWSEASGLPVDCYSEEDVKEKADEMYHHVFRVYPTVPSPYYEVGAAAGWGERQIRTRRWIRQTRSMETWSI